MAIIGDGSAGALMYRSIGYEPLVRWDPGWKRVVPNVAQAITVNSEATEYTVQLREGMRWSDGHPFTTDDIMFWAERILPDPALTSPSIREVFSIDGALGQFERRGPFVFRVTFPVPNGLFLQKLASGTPTASITDYPRHRLAPLFRDGDPKAIAQAIAETGAKDWRAMFEVKSRRFNTRADPALVFRTGIEGRQVALANDYKPWPTLDAWVPVAMEDGDPPRIIAKRNPYYWKIDPAGRQLPYIDSVAFHLVPGSPDAKSWEMMDRLILTDEIDMQLERIWHAAKSMPPKEPTPNLRLIPAMDAGGNALPLALNLTHPDLVKRRLFQDLGFRIALSQAIDRRRIMTEILQNNSQVYERPYQMAPRPESRFFHERLAFQHLAFDPAKSNRLLDELGLIRRDDQGFRRDETGRRLTIEVLVRSEKTGQRAMLARIVEDWKAVGIEVVVKPIPRRELSDVAIPGAAYDAVVTFDDGGMEAMMEPANYVPTRERSWFAPAWKTWFIDRNDPRAEEPPQGVRDQMALYATLQKTVDPEAQDELMRRILDIAADQFYMMGIALAGAEPGIAKKTMRNLPPYFVEAFIYPTPAPTNPSQYFFEAPR
ncbi:MAG: ABC transporter substrate-binding protein [Rhodospirillaceae bacterium]|nr:ABC transporter substrate-binding protein [Rhodospirillaceae bacterium]